MEAESEAVGMLVAGDGLENKFAALESGTVEDELAALKKVREAWTRRRAGSRGVRGWQRGGAVPWHSLTGPPTRWRR